MRIFKKRVDADGRGFVHVLIERSEDLYALSRVVESGDLATSKTSRKVILDRGDAKKDTKRVVVRLTIRVTGCEYAPGAAELRISGQTCSEADGIPLGSSHTFSVQENSAISVEKEAWSRQQLDVLSRAADPAERCSIAALLITRDGDGRMGLVDGDSVKLAGTVAHPIPKKKRTNGERIDRAFQSFHSKLVSLIRQNLRPDKIKILLLLGLQDVVQPAMSYFSANLTNSEPFKSLQVVPHYTTALGLFQAISQACQTPTIQKQMGELTWLRESKILDSFRRYCVKEPEKVRYGLKDVLRVISECRDAVDQMLICSTLLNSGDLETVNKLHQIVESRDFAGRLMVVDSYSEVGKQVHLFGDICCVLRYQVYLSPSGEAGEEGEDDSGSSFDTIDSDFE